MGNCDLIDGDKNDNNGNYPIKYVDNEWNETEDYPYNPNGSKDGICGFSSGCGRHLAMMPHPERCFMKWQIPYVERNTELDKLRFSPWILMFKNAYNWCDENSFN